MTSTNSSIACVPGALPGGLQRTSFFNGMFLTQSDLEVEQRFWRMKRRLTNRALGQGVVWGLRVAFDTRAQRLTLQPGYGIDCCGNDLIVQVTYEARPAEFIDVTDPATLALLPNKTGNEVALVLEYAECPEEPRPVHKDTCTPSADACESSRMRETTRLSIAALLPPEPTPIATFVAGIDKLRSDLEAAKDPNLTEVFPDLGPSVATAATLPFRLRVRLGDAETVVEPKASRTQLVVGLEQVIAQKVASGAAIVDVHFELVPDAGYVFCEGSVQLSAAVGNPISVSPPFDTLLAWSFQVTVEPPIAGTSPPPRRQAEAVFLVENLTVAALFGSGGRTKIGAFELGVGLSVEELPPIQDTFACHACLERIDLSNVGIVGHDALETGSCLNPLNKQFFLDSVKDASDVPRTILLAALYTWLTNMFGSANGYPPPDPRARNVFDGQRVIATWLYLIAWRMLFGAGAAAPDSPDSRQKLASLLDSLMAEWCAGFFYAGPRCPAKFHGAVLGTLTVNADGQVTALDMWKGRRWVLTGPLLNHWGAQLGLAPIDVVAGRLVTSICCLTLKPNSDGISPSMALPPLPDLGTPVWSVPFDGGTGGLAGGKFEKQSIGSAGIFLSDGCYLFFGTDAQVLKLLHQNGIPDKDVEIRSVPWAKFVMRLVDALGEQQPAGKVPTTYSIYQVDQELGARPFLIVATEPHRPSERERKRAQVRERIVALVEDYQERTLFPPLALPALVDFFTELTFDVPLFALLEALNSKVPGGAKLDVLTTLAEAGVVTCADALWLGIERLSDAASPPSKPHVDANDPTIVGLWRSITDADPKSLSFWENATTGAQKGIAAWQVNNNNNLFRRPNMADEKGFQPAVAEVLARLGAPLPPLADWLEFVKCAAERAVIIGPTS